jgi:outer membrane protein TolC
MRIALIDVTTSEAALAQDARTAVLGELLKLADESLDVILRRYRNGLASWSDVNLSLAEQSRIAARVSHEQGNCEDEIRALEQIIEAEKRRFAHLQAVFEANSEFVDNLELETARWRCNVARADLYIARVGREAKDASGGRKRQFRLQIQRATCERLKAELQQAGNVFQRRKAGYQVGLCSEFAVIESAARRRLAEIRLRQCEMDLARLRKAPQDKSISP